MEIVNLSAHKKKKTNPINPLAPIQPFRMLLSAPSGAGKTNLAGNLILNYLVFDRLYLWSKHIDDPNDIYVDLIEHYEKMERKIQRKTKDEDYKLLFYGSELEDLPSVEDLDYGYQNVVLLDDFINERNKANIQKIEEYFTSGRHKNCSVIIMSQSYASTWKKVRENCNYFVLFQMPTKSEIVEIAKKHACDLPHDLFIEAYQKATSGSHNFIVIDKLAPHLPFKYRRNFNEILEIIDEDNEE